MDDPSSTAASHAYPFQTTRDLVLVQADSIPRFRHVNFPALQQLIVATALAEVPRCKMRDVGLGDWESFYARSTELFDQTHNIMEEVERLPTSLVQTYSILAFLAATRLGHPYEMNLKTIERVQPTSQRVQADMLLRV